MVSITNLDQNFCHKLTSSPLVGKWDQNCDPKRFYPSITDVLQANGKSELVEYMTTVRTPPYPAVTDQLKVCVFQWWISNNEDDESFWQHEWNKVSSHRISDRVRAYPCNARQHGTCYSTLKPSCFAGDNLVGADVRQTPSSLVNSCQCWMTRLS